MKRFFFLTVISYNYGGKEALREHLAKTQTMFNLFSVDF